MNSAGAGPSSGSTSADLSSRLRYRLVRYVVIGSFLTLFLLVGVLLGIGQVGGKEAADLADKIFNTILPVLAGWVGTVLAYYFSTQNLESTNARLQQAIEHIGGGPPAQARATEKMIPVATIRCLYNLERQRPANIELLELKSLFNPEATHKPVTRLMFIENGQFRYVLHVGTLNAFLASPPDAPPVSLSLANLLNDDYYRHQITDLVTFVGPDATLAQAKATLDSLPGAQDIIVTSTGNQNGQMLGWITNVDLIKALSV